MPSTNGRTANRFGGLPDPFTLNALEQIAHNSFLARQHFIDRAIDGRRDIDEECNYPRGEVLPLDTYRMLYAREPIAERVVQVWPKETWQVQPHVYEDEDPETETEFEKAFDNLCRSLVSRQSLFDPSGGSQGGNPIWNYCCRADILSGIGTYGVMLLGFDDGLLLEQPVKGSPPDGPPKKASKRGQMTTPAEAVSKDLYGGVIPGVGGAGPSSAMGTDAQYFTHPFTPAGFDRTDGDGTPGTPELIFLRCFDETLVQVVQYEQDLRNPRFGQPIMYLIQFNDPSQPHTGVGLPMASVRVHWSRIIHLADNLRNSEIFGVPRMQPVLNRLLDLRKLYAGSAEMYWAGAFPGLSLETNPNLAGDVILDKPGIQSMMYAYRNQLQRYLQLVGMQAKVLSPTVVDPEAQVAAQLEAICIQLGIPVRVFKGSERGELASSQDDSTWNDRVRHRQLTYVTPRIIVPLIDRLISVWVLPKPKQYFIEWPDLDAQTKLQKAQIFLQSTQALAAYVAGNVQQLVAPMEFLTHYGEIEPDVAQQILEAAEDKQEEDQKEAEALAQKHGFVPQPPEGYDHPPPPAPPMPPQVLKPGERLVSPPQPPAGYPQQGGPPQQAGQGGSPRRPPPKGPPKPFSPRLK